MPSEAGRSRAEDMVRAAVWLTYLLNMVLTVFAFRGGVMPVLGFEAPGGWPFALLWFAVVSPVSSLAVAGLVSLLVGLRARLPATTAQTQPRQPTRTALPSGLPLKWSRRRSDRDLGSVHDALAAAAAAKTRVEEHDLIDPLTGLLSREGLFAALPDFSPPYAVTLVTVDRFSHIIEHDGHLAAERVLCDVAEVLRRGRAEDLVARWADCELMLVLAGTTASDGTARVRRLLADVHATVRINDHLIGLSAAITDAAADAPFADAVAHAEQAMSSAEPRLIVAR